MDADTETADRMALLCVLVSYCCPLLLLNFIIFRCLMFYEVFMFSGVKFVRKLTTLIL